VFFGFIDSDSSRSLTPAELRKGLLRHQVYLNNTDLANLLHMLDTNQDGTVSI
jgi:Ca2+-binding EF-hand superfamily protein